MNQNRLLFIQIQTPPPIMHHHKWKDLKSYVKQPMEFIEDELPT